MSVPLFRRVDGNLPAREHEHRVPGERARSAQASERLRPGKAYGLPWWGTGRIALRRLRPGSVVASEPRTGAFRRGTAARLAGARLAFRLLATSADLAAAFTTDAAVAR